MKQAFNIGVFAIAPLAGASPAYAHLVGASGAGFSQGIGHPFTGPDHMLAMIAVGFWASQQGGRALVVLPLLFPLMMGAGAFVGGEAGIPLAAIEVGVGASVLVLGVLVAMNITVPLPVSALLVALFALLHGHSHGTELPAAASPLGYAIGFMTSTLALHAIGMIAGLFARVPSYPTLSRFAGSSVAAAGIMIISDVT